MQVLAKEGLCVSTTTNCTHCHVLVADTCAPRATMSGGRVKQKAVVNKGVMAAAQKSARRQAKALTVKRRSRSDSDNELVHALANRKKASKSSKVKGSNYDEEEEE